MGAVTLDAAWLCSDGSMFLTLLLLLLLLLLLPVGRYILEATLDSKLRLVNFENGKVAKTYVGHKNEDYSSSMAFVSPIGPYVVSGSEDNSVVVWDVNSKQVGVPGFGGSG